MTWKASVYWKRAPIHISGNGLTSVPTPWQIYDDDDDDDDEFLYGAIFFNSIFKVNK